MACRFVVWGGGGGGEAGGGEDAAEVGGGVAVEEGGVGLFGQEFSNSAARCQSSVLELLPCSSAAVKRVLR